MQYKDLMEAFTAQFGIKDLNTSEGVVSLDLDDITVSFAHDESGDEINVYAEIGLPPPDANGRFGELMLKANHISQGPKGMVLCQNPENSAYAIYSTLPLASTDVESLSKVTGEIADAVERWRPILEGMREAEEAKAQMDEEEAAIQSNLGTLGAGQFMQV